MGLITGFYGLSNMMWGGLYFTLVKRQKKLALRNQENGKENGQEGNSQANGHAGIILAKNTADTDKESTI